MFYHRNCEKKFKVPQKRKLLENLPSRAKSWVLKMKYLLRLGVMTKTRMEFLISDDKAQNLFFYLR